MQLHILRHSCAHVLAQAVKELFPDVKLGTGPATENGFYYDFLKKEPFTPEDLKKIEKRMQFHIKKNERFKRIELSIAESKELLKNEPFKLELLAELIKNKEKPVFYKHGNFIDLCKGPHIKSTGEIKAFKLTKLAAAYWKGDEKNPQLQRIYGTAFNSASELKAYLKMLEEAEKRNHVKIGKKLGLFIFSPEVGPGLPIFTPKGTVIREELQKFMHEILVEENYQLVFTPHIAKTDLFKKSGHYPYYKEAMFEPLKCEGAEYLLKPMNCPYHILIYNMQLRSYKELPLRLAEFGTVYRYEKSGEVGGLTRVRMITQDDAHVFCMPNQVKQEITNMLNIVFKVFNCIGFKSYRIRFGTRDSSSKYIGDNEAWKKAEKDIETALTSSNLSFTKEPGEAAFYGPKIDFIAKDALGREWQLGTIQVDYNLPERFDLTYEGEDGRKHRPIMIHRAPFGSIERFCGVIIEHFGGRFPVWLAPVQVKILTVTSAHDKYAINLYNKLKAMNVRVELNLKSETIPKKVRDAQLEQVPYIVTIGDKEVQNDCLAVRTLDGRVVSMKTQMFINNLLNKINSRCLTY